MIVDKKIQELGLTDKEAKVYVALLELGQATAQQLSIKSGINRATTYVMLDILQAKGLVSTIEKGKKAYFIVEDPFSLIKSLEEEQKDVEERMGKAKKLIPELQLVYNLSRDRSKVRFFEGKDSIRIIQREVAKSKDKEVYEIFNINLVAKLWPYSEYDHRKTRDKVGYKSKVIISYDAKEPFPSFPEPKNRKRERRYVPQEKFPLEADIALYGKNKVAIITLKDNIVGVTIENEEVYNTVKVLFDSFWELSKQYEIQIGK